MRRRGYSTRELTYWVAGLVALAVTAGALVGSLPTGVRAAPEPRAPSTRVLAAAPSARVIAAAPVAVRRSAPVHLTIASLGISTTVGRLGLQANHQVMVPPNVHTVGWFRLGPTPGQMGSSVILGHVDSYLGPGVFFQIKSMRVGSSIEVRLADGVTTRFVVTRVVQYSKTGFPDRLVYGSHGTRSLNLVTCGGVFDHATGSYLSNVVVFSRLASVRRPTA